MTPYHLCTDIPHLVYHYTGLWGGVHQVVGQCVDTPECPFLTGLWGIALRAVGDWTYVPVSPCWTDPWGTGFLGAVLRAAGIPECPCWTGLQDSFLRGSLISLSS